MTKLINKIKLIWQGRSIMEEMLQIKSRWKEPTFWAALLGNIITAVSALKGALSPQAAIIINAVLSSGYNYVRGLQKAESDGVKPYSTSSEFWLGLASMANNAMIDMKTGGVATMWLGGATVLTGHAIAAARDLANMRPPEVIVAGASSDKE